MCIRDRCETALSGGKGKEVEGFATEVQQQGAKAVIATLWKVEDKSTSLLMRDFYRRMAQSKDIPKIEALRQAQIAMLEGTGAVPVNDENPETEVSLKSGSGGTVRLYNRDKQKPYAHPYFWAPFILFGNWK